MWLAESPDGASSWGSLKDLDSNRNHAREFRCFPRLRDRIFVTWISSTDTVVNAVLSFLYRGEPWMVHPPPDWPDGNGCAVHIEVHLSNIGEFFPLFKRNSLISFMDIFPPSFNFGIFEPFGRGESFAARRLKLLTSPG